VNGRARALMGLCEIEGTICWTTVHGGHGMPCPYNRGIAFSHRISRAR
jgi:hypothetical protein